MIEKRTKIITTIGPASESKEVMGKLFDAGMTTIRMNFSHGDHIEQGPRIVTAREISKEKGKPISLMLDTKGPEIRIGKMKDGVQEIAENEIVTIYTDADSYKNREGTTTSFTTAYDMSIDLEIGKIVLVDDGKLVLDVTDVKPGVILAKTRNHHILKNNKRINLPGTKFSMAFLADQDRADIRFGAKQGVDFIAASFVNTPEDIKEIRTILKEEKAEEILIYSKIESQYAVDHFDEILKVTDGVMVARGDLGLEIPYYKVPGAQKMMIRKCRKAGKPVIVATQMLDSMESTPYPTRAEVTDVYFATELGADATMLSGESAAGDFPVEAVKVMAKINETAEVDFYNKLFYKVQLDEVAKASTGQRAVIAEMIARKAISSEYKFAVVLSSTGALLKEVAKFRPNLAILGVVADPKQITKFGITSSVFVFPETSMFTTIKENLNAAKNVATRFNGKLGDKILVVQNDKISELTL
ncbi:pyruvate kinase [Candidatus Mycoplasma mahonii]|uniref:pyruvate kinase n=1 Tax=Candidatus Mycoplasma mahonii TaxID=3004105 RepID=UPI0026E9A8B9|nr:pyruvate kinase [Candidatus Mycoplasma mahonii]WKX02564.1 pyruvate kinase [Candidatus Mycoplasma mahonii]